MVFLVANKIDLKREISNAEAVDYAKIHGLKYFEVSVKTGFGIKEVFQQMYNDIFQLYKNL